MKNRNPHKETSTSNRKGMGIVGSQLTTTNPSQRRTRGTVRESGRSEFCSDTKVNSGDLASGVKTKDIPIEVLDLVRFMCNSWSDIDKWAYEHAGIDALCKYPVIQGTRNQLDLKKIGEQRFNSANIRKAVDWMLSQ